MIVLKTSISRLPHCGTIVLNFDALQVPNLTEMRNKTLPKFPVHKVLPVSTCGNTKDILCQQQL